MLLTWTFHFQTSTLADVAPVHSRLDHMEMAYAKEVIDYNNRVIQGAVRPQLVQKFASAAESFNNLVSLSTVPVSLA